MLLSSTSSGSHRIQNGNNLLHTCISESEAKSIVACHIDINGKNDLGRTPINSLMRMGNKKTIPVIIYLLSLEGIDVNATEPDGTTIAHLCEWGEIMNVLIKREDFNPNQIRSTDGNTPLMLCISYPKHPDIAKILLESPHLKLNIRNKLNGKTALEMAEESTHPSSKVILQLIKDKMDNCHDVVTPPTEQKPTNTKDSRWNCRCLQS